MPGGLKFIEETRAYFTKLAEYTAQMEKLAVGEAREKRVGGKEKGDAPLDLSNTPDLRKRLSRMSVEEKRVWRERTAVTGSKEHSEVSILILFSANSSY